MHNVISACKSALQGREEEKRVSLGTCLFLPQWGSSNVERHFIWEEPSPGWGKTESHIHGIFVNEAL